MRVFTNTEITEATGIERTARDLSLAAKSLKQRLQRQLTAAGTANTLFIYEDEDPSKPVLDFRAGTPLGQVYARFELVRHEQLILGLYAFFVQERDAQNKVTFRPVFSMLFNSQGQYLFGDAVSEHEKDLGFQELDMDFAWMLSGNLLLSIYHQLGHVQTKGFDIGTLGMDAQPVQKA